MHPTERADRLEQLRAELAETMKARAMEASNASTEYALASECVPYSVEYRSHMQRASLHCRGEFSLRMREAELFTEIAALESGRADVAAPVVLSGDEVRGMDEMAGVL